MKTCKLKSLMVPCSSALLLFVDFMGVEWNQLSEKATSYLNNPMDYVFNWTDFQFCPWFSRNEFFKFWPKKIHKFYLGHINFQKLVSISVLGLDLQIITKEEVTILTFVLKKVPFFDLQNADLKFHWSKTPKGRRWF